LESVKRDGHSELSSKVEDWDKNLGGFDFAKLGRGRTKHR